MAADLYMVGFLTEIQKLAYFSTFKVFLFDVQKLAYLPIMVALARRRILQSGRFRYRHGEKSPNLNKTFGLNLAL